MYSPSKPLQFVFANRSDTYFLENGLCVDLNVALWFELRQLQPTAYQEVYFINRTSSGIEVEVLDRTSFQASRKVLGKSGILFSNTSFTGRRVDVCTNLQLLREWIEVSIKKNEGRLRRLNSPGTRKAFVIHLEAFQELYANSGAGLNALIRSMDQTGNHSILILSCDTLSLEKNLKCFLDPKGLFGPREGGSVLCPEIPAICNMGRVPFFEQLFKLMQDRTECLSYYKERNLFAMMRHMMLTHPDRWCSKQQEDDNVIFLYYWCNCSAMRRELRLFQDLPALPAFHELYQKLGIDRNWKVFTEAVNALRRTGTGTLRQTLFERYGKVSPAHAFFRADSYAKEVKALVKPDALSWFEEQGKGSEKRTQALVDAHYTAWLTAWAIHCSEAARSWSHKFQQMYHRAVQQKDSRALRCAAMGLYFCGEWCCSCDEQAPRLEKICTDLSRLIDQAFVLTIEGNRIVTANEQLNEMEKTPHIRAMEPDIELLRMNLEQKAVAYTNKKTAFIAMETRMHSILEEKPLDMAKQSVNEDGAYARMRPHHGSFSEEDIRRALEKHSDEF